MNLKNVSPRAQLIGVVVVVAGLIISQSWLPPGDFRKKRLQINELQLRLEQKQAEIHKGRQAKIKLEELQRDIAALEQKLTDLKQILPTAPEMGDLLKWIKSLADQANLDLLNFSPQPLADQDFLREQPIYMDVVGNYHQLGVFFDRISKYARIINVENVRIQNNAERQTQATIRANFVAKTFMYKEDAQQKGAGGGA